MELVAGDQGSPSPCALLNGPVPGRRRRCCLRLATPLNRVPQEESSAVHEPTAVAELRGRREKCLYGCYVHSSIIPTFHRRCYWLLQSSDRAYTLRKHRHRRVGDRGPWQRDIAHHEENSCFSSMLACEPCPNGTPRGEMEEGRGTELGIDPRGVYISRLLCTRHACNLSSSPATPAPSARPIITNPPLHSSCHFPSPSEAYTL
ncbi:unnamed protein product [Gadus morhua 'NCC']